MTAIYETGNIPFITSASNGAKFSFKAIRFLCNCRTLKIQQQPIEPKCNGIANVQCPKRTTPFEMEMQLLAENENDSMPIRFQIFSWFFAVTNKSKNYSLEPMIKCLKFIRRSNTMKTINKKTFPLDRIVYESAGNNYYGYMDCAPPPTTTTAATQLHHTDEIYHQFIEANHLIPIGITQLREFHKLALHHHIECCAVNKSVRIENHHSSNAQRQISGREFKQNDDKANDEWKGDREQQAQHSSIQMIIDNKKST